MPRTSGARPGRSAWSTASLAIPGVVGARRGRLSRPRRSPRSGLDYLALGHWHSAQQGKAGATIVRLQRRAGAGRRSTRTGPGNVLLVTLDGTGRAEDGDRRGAPDRADPLRARSRSTSPTIGSQPALVEQLRAMADPRPRARRPARPASGRTSSTSTTTRSRPSSRGRFFRLRVRDRSVPPLTEGALPPPDTDRRRVHPRPRGPDRRARGGRRGRRGRPSCATRSGSAGSSWPATR